MYICLQMFVSKIQAQEPVSLPFHTYGRLQISFEKDIIYFEFQHLTS